MKRFLLLLVLLLAFPAAAAAQTSVQRAENTLNPIVHRNCKGYEIYVDGSPFQTCYSSAAACWGRGSPYWNIKCWMSFHMRLHSRVPGLPDPTYRWIFCVKAARANLAGRVFQKDRDYHCTRSKLGPPDFA